MIKVYMNQNRLLEKYQCTVNFKLILKVIGDSYEGKNVTTLDKGK